jgi:hydroxymethylpyrimidine pyrophosphatase-like HAD family hydrolase
MKLSVLALDYDGTVARGDRLDPSVRRAIADARERGILVLLVTGRILSELERVAGDLHFVDAVVAENGAVIYFPDSGHSSIVAPPVHAAFLAELRRRGIPHQAGQSLVDAEAADAPRLLETIRSLELPLVMLFNRSRVMVLPQGISKATGLHQALDILRASARNMVAIGDAENDHELLRLAEVGAAVEWGTPALKQMADDIVKGNGPVAVADYLGAFVARGSLPIPPRPRRRLLLGYEEDGRPFSLAVRGRNALIAGDAKSGKSWIAGLFCEQLILLGYSICVIDPEGDYRSLEAMPGVTVLGGEEPPPTPRALLSALRYPDRSVVIDLSRLRYNAKIPYVRALLRALAAIRRRTGLPHRVLLDEAHYFLHEGDALSLLDLTVNGYIVVSYRASQLPRELLAASEVVIVTSESSVTEIQAFCGLSFGNACRDVDAWARILGHLGPKQAAALPVTAECDGRLRIFTMAQRLTPHVRHREKYADVPVPDNRAFVFSANGLSGVQARTLREFVAGLEQSGSASTVDGHLRRSDFSRWIRDVYGDHALASELATLEDQYRLRLDSDVIPEIAHAIRARYDLTGEVDPAPVATADIVVR